MKYKLLQEYLRNYGPALLEQQYSITAKQHSKYPNLYLFKYNQIESPMHEPIVQVCRGIILDKDNNWNVVSFAFEKFWNAGEHLAAKVNWNQANVYEKLDGSLMTLYWYDNQWQVASSGTPDAIGEVNKFNFSFAELFWKVWNELKYNLPLDTTYCYMFELMTPYNRIVVPHKKNRLVLHGIRDLVSMKEIYIDPRLLEGCNWEVVKSLPLHSFKEENDITFLAQNIDPMESEGFVVCDKEFNRLKIKSPKYVALHHAIDGLTPRRMLEIIQLNETSEFLSYFPQYQEIYDTINNRFQKFVLEAEIYYKQHEHIANQKEFALRVKDSKFAGACFAMKAKKTLSLKDYYNKMQIQHLEELLQLGEIVYGQ